MSHRRARYLRLPTSGPRSTASPARPIAGPSQTSGSPRFPFSRRFVEIECSPDDTSKADPRRRMPFPTSSEPLGARPGIARLLSDKHRSSANATRPGHPSSTSHEPSPMRTQSSIAPGREITFVGSRQPDRSRNRGLRESSPARSRTSSSRTKDVRDREGSPRRSPSHPTSSAGGDLSRTRLWLELREVQRKPKPPTERS